MKLLILWLLAGVALCSASAQSAYYTTLQSQLSSKYSVSGGVWLLPNDETQLLNAANSYGGNLGGLATLSGQSFTKTRQLSIAGAGSESYSSGIFWSNTQPMNKGELGLAIIWARSTTVDKGKVNIFLERANTFEKEIFIAVNVPSTWQQFIIPFDADFNYTTKQLNFGFHTGYQAQNIEIGGVALINFKNAYTLDRFPIQLFQNYAGAEANAPWRAEAEQRIEQNRKADFTVKVTNANGDAVSGAAVKMEMLEHAFKFGSAITANRIAGNRAQDITYQQKILDFDGKGHGFNEVVFENDLKWDGWEQSWLVTHPELVKAVAWLNGQGISIRGHNLVWPSWQYMPADMKNNQGNPSYLKQRINSHLSELLNYPGIKGVIKEWDVLNEITQNEELAKALAGTAGYPSGREIYVDIVKKVKELDPGVQVYLNDYVTIDQGNTPGNPLYERCKQYLREVQNNGGKIDGIGFQAHIGSGLISMYDVKNTLDDFYTSFGARAKITEYDYGNLVSDSLSAKFTADFLTMCFSHSSVDGFLSWGFWNGAHWLDNAPFFRKDWSMRPAGKAVADLLFDKWWTNASASTNADGAATIRGFKGKYRITVLYNGKLAYTNTLNLSQNSNLSISLPNTVGLNDPGSENFKLQFANPAQIESRVAVTCSTTTLKAQLISIDGKILLQLNKPGTNFELLTPSTAGLYILRVQLENGQWVGQKLLIELKK
jgi:GH35 family endo-1,4-beta-xylanase